MVALAVFEDKVAELVRECGKSPQTLHKLVGTSIKKPRDISGWNVWQRWYSVEHPKHEDMSSAEYNQLSRSSFKQECAQNGVSPGDISDSDAVFKALPWLLTWHTKLMTNVTHEWRDKGKFKSAVQKEMKAMVQLSSAMYKSLGVHVWGYCIDTQGQASFTWGGTDDFKAVRSSNKQSLSQTIKDMEHMFGMIDIQRWGVAAAEEGSALLPVVVPQREGEFPRDAHRRIFTSLLSTQLQTRLIAGGALPLDKINKIKMQWGPKFLDAAWEHKFRIINYPSALEDSEQIIGGKFEVKRISTTQYKTFLPPMQQANKRKAGNAADDAEEEDQEEDDSEGAMAIVSWTEDEKELSLEEQRDIGLVVSLTGARLRSVKHSKQYNNELDKKDKAQKKSAKKSSKDKAAPPPPRIPRDNGATRYAPDAAWEGAGSDYARPPRETSRHDGLHPPRGRTEAPAYYVQSDYRRPDSPASSRYAASSRHRSPQPPPARTGSSRHQDRPSHHRSPPPPPPRTTPAAYPSAPRREERTYVRGPRVDSSRHRTPSCDVRTYATTRGEGSSRPPPPPAAEAHPPPPQRTYAGATKRRANLSASPDAAKRRRLEVSAQPKLWRLRFRVRNSPHTTKIWYASGFERVDHPTRADENTLRWDATTEDWVLLAPGLTPILTSEDDRGRYQREVHEYGLYGPARG
ncbi:hypothetical protein C8R44DRAFT_753203 [Mycena epipterygia]|nr:hypothetical protein C8R44DRAFT_753203 [Mycena epipterygia]